MKEKFYIYNLMKKYIKFNNYNFVIETTKKEKINFDMKLSTICYLLGLHYCYKDKKKECSIEKRILENRLTDKYIYDLIEKNTSTIELNSVKKKITNIEDFLLNLDKGLIFNIQNEGNSSLSLIDSIVVKKDKKILQMKVINMFDEEYYLNSFLVMNNKDEFESKNKILGIYVEDENFNLEKISFDLEKQEVLDNNKDLSYEECMSLYYEELK